MEILQDVKPYWIYDYDVAQRLDVNAEILRIKACELSLIQLRIKSLEAAEKEEIAAFYAKIIREVNPVCKIIMNDSVELCKKLDLDGVHLGQSDCSVCDARKTLGTAAIIGLTCRSHEEVVKALPLLEEGIVDYFGVGTVFQTTTKQGLKAKGLDFIKEILEKVPAEKLYPIGGITQNNAQLLYDLGVIHVAICSDLYL